jgi:hypothetical protein
MKIILIILYFYKDLSENEKCVPKIFECYNNCSVIFQNFNYRKLNILKV